MQTEPLYHLTHAQQGIWYYENIYRGTAANNIAFAVKVAQPVDCALWVEAMQMVISRHDGLHLRLVSAEGEVRQYVAKQCDRRQVEVIDLGSAAGLSSAVEWFNTKTRECFQLNGGDLFYAAIVLYNEREICYYLKIHHLISDGWTMGLIARQVYDTYLALQKDKRYQLPDQPTYGAYLAYEQEYLQSPRLAKDRAFWLEQLKDLQTAAFFKPKLESCNGIAADRRVFTLSDELWTSLTNFCTDHQTSIFNVFMGVLYIYMSRVTLNPDVVIGTMLHNRNNAVEKKMAGMFVQAVPVRLCISEQTIDFSGLLQEIKRKLSGIIRHQRYPYDLMVQDLRLQEIATAGLLDVVLIYHPPVPYTAVETPYMEHFFTGAAINPLTVHINRNNAEHDGRLELDFEYQTAVFTADEIEAMNRSFVELLTNALSQPSCPVCQLDMVTAVERQALLALNHTVRWEGPDCIQTVFEQQAERTPDATALWYEGGHLTFRQLNNAANHLAGRLARVGLERNEIVGLQADRSPTMIIGILGILKAGAAYLPLEPTYPAARLQYMAAEAGIRLAVVRRGLEVKYRVDQLIEIDENCHDWGTDLPNPANITQSSDLAYIIFTSGSTGRPKGVMVNHGAITNGWYWLQHTYPIRCNDVVMQKTSYTFDVSVWEILFSLSAGAALCLLPPGGEKDPASILRAVERYGVTILYFVPSALDRWLQYVEDASVVDRLSSIRQIIASGEALDGTCVERFRRVLGTRGAALLNMYGPTEATVHVSHYRADQGIEPSSVPIGRPVANTELYVLYHNRLQPFNVAGELCIGGVQVARGYLHNETETAARFVANPFKPDDTLYRTGDIALVRADGNIEFRGRCDQQVKIRGYRIEIGEIESLLLAHPAVLQAVVDVRQQIGRDRYICAYIVTNGTLNEQALKAFLMQELPAYMIPAQFVMLQELPTTDSGKIDRRALPDPQASVSAVSKYNGPANDTERLLHAIWQEVLGLERVDVNDDFFALGGHSLKAITMAGKVYEQFGVELPIGIMFHKPTIRTNAAYIDRLREDKPFVLEERFVLLNGEQEHWIFAFPPVLGIGAAYRGLAGYLTNYTLCCFNFTNQHDKVAGYVAAMEELHPGPYVLLGYSAGGNIAFETAKALEQRGAVVSDVIIIDTFRKMRSEKWTIDRLRREADYQLQTHEQELAEYCRRVNSPYISERFYERLYDYLFYVRNGIVNNDTIAANIHYLISEDQDEQLQTAALEEFEGLVGKWSEATTGKYRCYQGYGIHHDMLKGGQNIFAPNNLAKNAAVIRSILAEI